MMPIRRLSYHQQRMLHGRRALLGWLRRWGAYLAVAGVLFAAGTDSPVAILAAGLGTLVMPLLGAVQALQAAPSAAAALASAGLLLGVVLLQALVGTLPLVLTRPLWWPAAWAQAERALPLSPQVLCHSDRRLLAWVLLPTQALPWAGAWALGLASPVLWQHGLPGVMLALAGCGTASAALGLHGMRWLRARSGAQRRAVRALAAPSSRRSPRSSAAVTLQRQPTWRVVWWWPLRRGLAWRTMHGLVAGTLATPALAAGPLSTPPADAGWWLAALALVALGSTAWLRSRVRDELAPLWRALRPLPVPAPELQRQARGLAVLPTLIGLALAGPVLAALGARQALLLVWCLATAGACWWEAHPPPADATQHALRWLFCLTVLVCLGSEVMP